MCRMSADLYLHSQVQHLRKGLKIIYTSHQLMKRSVSLLEHQIYINKPEMNIEHQTSIKLIYMKPFIALYLYH